MYRLQNNPDRRRQTTAPQYHHIATSPYTSPQAAKMLWLWLHGGGVKGAHKPVEGVTRQSATTARKDIL